MYPWDHSDTPKPSHISTPTAVKTQTQHSQLLILLAVEVEFLGYLEE